MNKKLTLALYCTLLLALLGASSVSVSATTVSLCTAGCNFTAFNDSLSWADSDANPTIMVNGCDSDGVWSDNTPQAYTMSYGSALFRLNFTTACTFDFNTSTITDTTTDNGILFYSGENIINNNITVKNGNFNDIYGFFLFNQANTTDGHHHRLLNNNITLETNTVFLSVWDSDDFIIANNNVDGGWSISTAIYLYGDNLLAENNSFNNFGSTVGFFCGWRITRTHQ